MPTVRRQPGPHADRPSRAVAAIAVAVIALAGLVAPAAAADPAADPSPSAVASASPMESPSDSPSESPSESPSGSPTPSPTPAPTPLPFSTAVTPLGATVTFFGRGYGHGVGMSQYGARGRALDGQLYPQILAQYFRNTALGTWDPKANVRVLLLTRFNATSTRPLVVYGRRGSWTIDGIAKTFPADAVLRAWRTSTTVDGVTSVTWRATVKSASGTVLHSGVVSGSLWIRPAVAATQLQLYSKPSSFDTYRGVLRAILGTASTNVINHVQLDLYLRGVVPIEMPASWPAEAVKAQAITARSYAVRRLHPGTGTFDLYDDSRTQIYRGIEGENSVATRILNEVAGVVVKSGSLVANTVFHSTAGGWTENNEYAFVPSSGAVTSSPVGYLRGAADRSGSGAPYDAAAPYYAWATTSVSLAQLSAMFATDARTNVGALTALDLRVRGVSGRVVRVTLIGSLGTRTVSADVFRAVYNAARPSGAAYFRGNLFDTTPLP